MKIKFIVLLVLTLSSHLPAKAYTPPLEPQTEFEHLAVIFAKYANNLGSTSPLHTAILQNDAFAIDLLLKYGARFDTRSFYYAIVAGNIELVDKLLKLQMDPNLDCYSEGEPLKIAISQYQNEIAKFLIDFGVDLHKHTSSSDDYLHACCENGNSEVFIYLMERGAKPAKNDYSSYFCMLIKGKECELQENSLVEGKIEILKYLDSRNLLKSDFKNDISFSYIYPEALQYLLDYRFIQPNMQRGDNPILFDVMWNCACRLELINILFDYGVDVNAKDAAGQNVLFYLMRYPFGGRQKDLISLLVDLGADLHAKNKQGKTPLSYATNDDMREFLISLGAK